MSTLRNSLLGLISLIGLALFAEETRPPNILFILADDMGYGELGCYGQKELETPRVDQMAQEGMRFTRFYAGAPVCAPSRSVLMTGLHTGHTRVRGNDGARNYLGQTLLAEDATFPEMLQENGYKTSLVGKWGLGELGSEGTPDKKGFDTYFGFVNQSHAHNHFPSYLIRDGQRVELPNDLVQAGRSDGAGYSNNKLVYANDLFFAEARTFVKENVDTPFFLYLSLTIPHANNEATKLLGDGMEVPDYGEYSTRDWPSYHKGHAEMNARIDRGVGALIDLVDELGIGEDTLIVFTSDNGPHNEGGAGYNPEFFDSNGSLRGIKRDLTDGGIRVPMIVRWPGNVPEGTVSAHVSSFADVYPTVAEIIGEETPTTDGISFVPSLIQSGEQQEHEFLYWEFYGAKTTQAVLLNGRWKGIREDGFDKPIVLYDLLSDPGEFANRAENHPEIVEEIAELMDTQHVPNAAWSLR